jgi:hypothetical protein
MGEQSDIKRVIAYIDGFNLYYGLCDSRYRRFLWLNLGGMVQSLLRPDQQLVCTKYFTARISTAKPTDSPKYIAERTARKTRQDTFLSALRTVPNLKIYEGHYREEQIVCSKCGATWMDAEEKMTDVRIATEMIVDTFANRFDVALLVSGDSDLVPPIEAIKSSHPHKRINIAFPPGRHSHWLKQAAHGQCIIGRGTLSKNRFPPVVLAASGAELHQPIEWTKELDTPRTPPARSR